MTEVFLSVILPITDEEKKITLFLIELDRYLSLQDFSYETIITFDSNNKKVRKLITKLQSSIENLKQLPLLEAKGEKAITEAGIRISHGDWYLVLNPQMEIPLIEINKIFQYMAESDSVEALTNLPGSYPQKNKTFSILCQKNTKDITKSVKIPIFS